MRRVLGRFQMQRSLDSFFGAGAKRSATNAASPSTPSKKIATVQAVKSDNSTTPASGPESVAPASSNDIYYEVLASTFEKIEATSKRLEIQKHCASLYTDVLKHDSTPATLAKVAYLCINRLGPDYEGLELGLGESIIIKALAESTGRSIADVKKDYVKLGDLGLVALASKKAQATMFQPKPLMVSKVFAKLKQIASSQGQQSQARKIGIIKEMLVSCRGQEAKYIVRSLEGKLRIGLAEKTVQIALSQAFTLYDNTIEGRAVVAMDKAEEIVKEAFCQLPNYDIVIGAALEHGVANLAKFVTITPGIPLKPMLAKPTKSITEVLDRFQGEKFTCEYKYDGERAQVHCTADGSIHIYSRNMEDMSQRYPDIAEIVPHIRKSEAKDFILDCEAVAWDAEQKKILPFQVLSTRKRKDVETGQIKVRVHLFAFDCLYLNGESRLTQSLEERRALIHEYFEAVPGAFQAATAMDSETIDDIQHFLDQSVKDGCEGLMIKMLVGTESGYEPSKRSRNWLKLKKDYLDGIGDSLDLVVLGAYYGRGKRTSVYGGFLLGCFNPDSEEYESVCKIGTGFSEADLERFHAELSPLADSKPKSYILHDRSPNQQPDVWFEPRVVWEVLTADLSLSPVYQAGASELGKGISLRFPRFIREREDKGAEDATNTEQLIHMYQRQASVASTLD